MLWVPKRRKVRQCPESRVAEILTAISKGSVTQEQMSTMVRLPNGDVVLWRAVTVEELQQLRRAYAF